MGNQLQCCEGCENILSPGQNAELDFDKVDELN